MISKDIKQIFFHDLKNKLLTIKLNVYLVLNKDLPEEKKKDLLEKVAITTDQALDLVLDILDMEKFKSIRFLKYEKFDLSELIEEVIEDLKIEAQSKGIKILFVKPKDKIIIKSNRYWLKKAFYNILHNSIKYNIQNGKVLINIHSKSNGYFIIIKDTGCGISISQKEKIFKKYYTTDKKEGTGIGLSFSKTVIEKLGGTIILKSEKEKGSAFYIFLPKKVKRKLTFAKFLK